MSLGTLAASLLGNPLTGKDTSRTGEVTIGAGGNCRTHPLTNFEVQKYYGN